MRCRRSRIDADGQAVPGKELPKLTEANFRQFCQYTGRASGGFLDRPGQPAAVASTWVSRIATRPEIDPASPPASFVGLRMTGSPAKAETTVK